MDELGAALRRVSKFLSREWIDASTASIARFENGHLFAGACKLPSGYQARGARADNHEVGQSHRLATHLLEDQIHDGMLLLAQKRITSCTPSDYFDQKASGYDCTFFGARTVFKPQDRV